MGADDHPEDRAAILARRALFVGGALAALSCAGAERPEPPPAVAPSPSDAGTPVAPPQASPPPPSAPELSNVRSFDAIAASIPPLGVAAGLPKRDAAELGGLEKSLLPAYQQLRKAYEIADVGCSLAAEPCLARWTHATTELSRVLRQVTPLCMGDSMGTAYTQRVNAHAQFVHGIVGREMTELEAAAKTRGEEGTATSLTRAAFAQPCLSCSAAQTPVRIWVEVSFDTGKWRVGPAHARRLASMKELADKSPGLRFVVRGHADPNEPEANDLSRARAAEVARELEKLGVAAARMEVVALGAMIPIALSVTEGGRRRNQRVDFEWVQPM